MVLRHRTSRSSKLYDVLLLTIVCIISLLNVLQSRLIPTSASGSAILSPPPSLLRRNSLASVKFSKKKKRRPRNVNATYCKSSAVACYNCSYSNHSYHRLPKIPQFIIVGAQKSGTTALYEFLKEHSQFRGSIVPETHFFDWYFPNGPEERKRFFQEHKLSNTTQEDELQCAIRKANSDSFDWATAVPPGGDDVHQNSTIFVEKTPSYLFLPEIPGRISTTCFWKPKMIVVLRNPIDRALSHYKMRILVKGRSFEKIIDEEMESLRNLGLSQAPLRLESNITFQDPRFDVLPNLSLKELKEKHWKHYRKVRTKHTVHFVFSIWLAITHIKAIVARCSRRTICNGECTLSNCGAGWSILSYKRHCM
eukprot:scaffold3716_cov69-Cylindrotheca_fusiformis.AAC.6